MPKRTSHVGGAAFRDPRQGSPVEPVSDTGRYAQKVLRLLRQPLQASNHEVDDVVGHHRLADRLQAEPPLVHGRIEGDEPVAVEGAEELPEEKRVPVCLLQHQLGQ